MAVSNISLTVHPKWYDRLDSKRSLSVIILVAIVMLVDGGLANAWGS